VREVTGGPKVDVRSRVEALYGDSIRSLVRETLATLGAEDLSVTLEDAGALPFTIAARLEAAVRRLRPATPAAALPALPSPGPGGATARDRRRRTRLYLPGDTPRYFVNAGLHRPDAVVLDLEDSVPPAHKAAARILVRNALRAVSFYGAERMVRINPLPAGLEDVIALAPHGVDVFVIPKVEGPEAVVAAGEALAGLRRDGRLPGPVWLLPLVESARGVLAAPAIAGAAPEVVGLGIGVEDYTADVGARRTPEGLETLWARSQVVAAARAAGVQPLASVFADLDDAGGLRRWAEAARDLGFEGAGCIHPRQVRPVRASFTPSPDEVAHARRIVAAFEGLEDAEDGVPGAVEGEGRGVVAVEGEMVDAPVVARAHRVLRLAGAAGTTRAAPGSAPGSAPGAAAERTGG
jgi:citrate lyase subunit beta/citryl-CoA lyase